MSLTDADFFFIIPGHESYPNRFDVDMDSQMLGSIKPYRRQVCSLPLFNHLQRHILSSLAGRHFYRKI